MICYSLHWLIYKIELENICWYKFSVKKKWICINLRLFVSSTCVQCTAVNTVYINQQKPEKESEWKYGYSTSMKLCGYALTLLSLFTTAVLWMCNTLCSAIVAFFSALPACWILNVINSRTLVQWTKEWNPLVGNQITRLAAPGPAYWQPAPCPPCPLPNRRSH